MAQDLSVFNAQHWAKEMQLMYFKENVARAIANEELRDVLVDGTRVHRPYRGGLIDQEYSRTAVISTFNELGGQDEYLDVDTARVVPFYVDDLDKLDNKWDMQRIYAQDAQKVLNNRIDQAVLAEYSNAHSFVSAQDLGGSGTGEAVVNTSNVSNLFTVAGRQLDKFNRSLGQRFAIIGPRLKELIKLAAAGRETAWGDMVGANGLVGPRFGFECYLSNNVPFTAVVTNSGIPTAGQYFYVDGVAFKWVADGTAAAAGEVSLGDGGGGTADKAYANLVLAINGTGTPGVNTYIEISADDRDQLRMGAITASYNSGTDVLTISGYGDVVVSIGTTANVALTSNVQHPLFGVKKAIDLVIKKEANLDFRKPSNRLGTNVFAWTYYGKKTFTKEKKSLVYAKIDTSSWV